MPETLQMPSFHSSYRKLIEQNRNLISRDNQHKQHSRLQYLPRGKNLLPRKGSIGMYIFNKDLSKYFATSYSIRVKFDVDFYKQLRINH